MLHIVADIGYAKLSHQETLALQEKLEGVHGDQVLSVPPNDAKKLGDMVVF